MPRRKKHEEPILNDGALLMLPAPRPSHKREHEHDLYESPPGAVPHVTAQAPVKRKLTGPEKEQQLATRKEHRMLAARHARYLDLLIETQNNKALALAKIFGISEAEVEPQLLDLLAEVRRGLAVSPLGELLELHGIGVAGRVNLLAKHAYSDNPAASLKAIDMISEAAGQTANEGSYESFLRTAKMMKAAR